MLDFPEYIVPEGKIPCDFCDKKLPCLGDSEVDPKQCKVIFVNGEPKAITVKPITILCHRGDMNIHVPNEVEISSPATLARAQRLTQQELDLLQVCGVKELFDLVFEANQHIKMPTTIKELQMKGSGVLHVVGMLTMIYEAVLDNKRFFLRHPETHLHPSAHTGLAEMMIRLIQGGKSEASETPTTT